MPLSQTQVVLGVATALAVFAGAGALVLVLQDDDEARLTPVAAPATPSPTATPTPSPEPSPTPTVPPLTEAALRGAPVPSLCGHPEGQLVDGELPGIPEGQGGVALGAVELTDLDGDGVDEAVVTMGCNVGLRPLSAVLVYSTGPVLVGRVPVEEGLDSEVRYHQVRLLPGGFEVAGSFQKGGDPTCCPTGRVVRAYTLVDGGIVQQPPVGVDDGAPVTGDGWSTVRVGDDYEQLARATGLPVTLDALEEGDPAEAGCAYVSLIGTEVGIVGGDGRVGAVSFGEPGVLSKSGVGVGDPEERVLAVYGQRAQRVPNTYGPVEDVVVPAGAGRVVRFEFDEQRRVSVMHAGLTDFAMLAEGCA